MKTALLKNMNDVVIRDIPLWPLERDEIRIRVDACGICGTDITSAHDGKDDYSPFGHEVAGTILETGSAVSRVKAGQRVVLESASACGQCLNCRDTRQELCSDIKSFFFKTSFGFAQEMISPAICAIPYEGMSPEEVCISEPLGVAIDLHRLADIQMGSHVVVSGLGPIGLMALRLARMSGAEKIYACALSHSKIRTDLAKRWGADEIIEVDKTPIESYRFEKAPDRFMITSPPQTLVPMMKIAAKGAILSFIGIKFGDAGIISFDANDFHFKKLQLRASFASPALYTPKAIHLIATGVINARELISHTFSLDQMVQALATAADSSISLKVIVNPNDRKG